MLRTRTTRPYLGRRAAVGLLALAVLTGGCSEVEEVAEWARGLLGDGQEAVDEIAAEPKPEEEPEPEVVEAETAEPEVVEEEPSEPEAEEGPPAFELDLPGIELLTPMSGEGQRPVLTWDSVDGAASYLVVLRAAPEAPASWLWRGDRTEIRVGFVTDPGLGGPEVRDGMVWSVLAFDADDVPLAQSGQRPIAP